MSFFTQTQTIGDNSAARVAQRKLFAGGACAEVARPTGVIVLSRSAQPHDAVLPIPAGIGIHLWPESRQGISAACVRDQIFGSFVPP
jgi:hypothetical protein